MYPRFLQFGAFVISTYGVLADACRAVRHCALDQHRAPHRPGLGEDPERGGLCSLCVCVVVGARLAVVVANWRGFLEAPLLILSAGHTEHGYRMGQRSHLRRGAGCRCSRCLPAACARADGDSCAGCGSARDDCSRWRFSISGNFAAGSHGATPPTAAMGCRTYTQPALPRAPRAFAVGALRLHPGADAMPPWDTSRSPARWSSCCVTGVRAAEVLGTALFADGVLRFPAAAQCQGDYADASVLFHIASHPRQAIAMLMVVLGGVCWLEAVLARCDDRNGGDCILPEIATPDTAPASRMLVVPADGRRPPARSISRQKLSPSVVRVCNGCCPRERGAARRQAAQGQPEAARQ